MLLCSKWGCDALAVSERGPFQLGRKAILGLSLLGCAPGVSGIPAGPRGEGWGGSGPPRGWRRGKQLVSEGEREEGREM